MRSEIISEVLGCFEEVRRVVLWIKTPNGAQRVLAVRAIGRYVQFTVIVAAGRQTKKAPYRCMHHLLSPYGMTYLHPLRIPGINMFYARYFV